ncbi:MAG TPA: hypothetical protein VGS08_00900 [Candidatus Saccharimonadales bacterium]|nr:hypothetical protein [Candidatus Saccharimonadales bacterium]
MLIRHLSRNQLGDTIVEVLIAVSIVSLILGGAYVISNNSLHATRDAQEHAQAVQLLQGQIEGLKSVIATESSALPTIFPSTSNSGPFCITSTAGSLSVSIATPGAPNNPCQLNSAGVEDNQVDQTTYNVTITGHTLGASHPKGWGFTARASWSGAASVNDQVQLSYRIYQP